MEVNFHLEYLMKRNDLELEIEFMLDDLIEKYNNKTIYTNLEAKKFLNKLEELGMLPPPHYIIKAGDPEYMKIKVHKWEDEDNN